MIRSPMRIVYVAMLALAVVACGAPQRGAGTQAQEPRSEARGGPKRITIAINVEPPALHYAVIPNPIRANPGSIQEIIHPGITAWDNQGTLRPILAEAVPSIENGLWNVSPDGQMDMTWTIKQRATWHDGEPLTSADLEFTTMLMQDKELVVFRDQYSDLIDGVETPDERTITVHWKKPFIDADTLFTHTRGLPVPKHIMGKIYTDNKAAFLDSPFWSTDFVGTGPFRLKDWARGSHLILESWPPTRITCWASRSWTRSRSTSSPMATRSSPTSWPDRST